MSVVCTRLIKLKVLRENAFATKAEQHWVLSVALRKRLAAKVYWPITEASGTGPEVGRTPTVGIRRFSV